MDHLKGRASWRLLGAAALAVIVYASLFLPPELEQLRTGYWAIEHFLAYFTAMGILCLGWPRPVHVAMALIALAALLEALQTLKPDHTLNIFAALSSMVGVLAAVPLVFLILRRRDLSAS
jgi:VanZ family protein